MPDRWTCGSSRIAFIGLSLAVVASSLPAAAAVIVPVSITRTVSASSSVTNRAAGTEDVDSEHPAPTTNTTLDFSVSANPTSSLNGWSASGSATAGAVGLPDLGAGTFGIRLSLGTEASVGGSAATCSPIDCAGGASSSAKIEFTFDLTAPIHVSSFYANPFPQFSLGTFGMGLSSGGQEIAGSTSFAAPPFDLAPGRYTLTGIASSSAFVDASLFINRPSSANGIFGSVDYTVFPVPEPTSGLLVSVGLLGLGGARRGARRP